MGRYVGPACKRCRREGDKLYLKGEKCYTDKCSFKKRAYAPGQHGNIRPKISDYRRRLRETQKAKWIYGVREKPFENYFCRASRLKGKAGEELLVLLERRLDNVIYRLGLANSRPQAREMVRHRHVMVNGRRVNIPSYEVKVGDNLAIHPHSQARVKNIFEKMGERTLPAWLALDKNKFEAQVLTLPTRDMINLPVEEHLIVEFYS